MGKKKSTKELSEARRAKLSAERSVAISLQVRDLAHARSQEVLEFCIKELTSGSTWNELRHKLGLGPSGVDNRWRVIKEILCSAIMPENEDEALKAALSMSNYISGELERFMTDLDGRIVDKKGSKEEDKFLKLKLEALRYQAEEYSKRFEHYAKLHDLKKKDQKQQGASIIFQNNYFVPRPGQNVKFVDGRPVLEIPEPKPNVENFVEIADGTRRK